MTRILFLSAYHLDTSGLSGGDRIFIELCRYWRSRMKVSVFGSEETFSFLDRYQVSVEEGFLFDRNNAWKNKMSIFPLAVHVVRRVLLGFWGLWKNRGKLRDFTHVYSASDFLPDVLVALALKLFFNRRIIWMAGYYLFIPAPWSGTSPYKGLARIRNTVYWLMQRITHPLVNFFAKKVMITSEPDRIYFSRNRDSKNIVVVRGGVDTSESSAYLQSGANLPGAAKEKKYDACFMGRLHFQKGVMELVDIWALVAAKRPGVKLAVIGEGPLGEEMDARIREKNLGEWIDRVGFLDGPPKHEVFKNSKMILHPAIYDSGGMASAEGMAWGLPGISFDLPALKTYYPKGMIKIPCFDKALFAEAVCRLLDDTDLYQKTSGDAVRLIEEAWSWEKRASDLHAELF